MQINLSPAELQNLTNQATAAGFEDVESFVTRYVQHLALNEEPSIANSAPLSEKVLEASLAELEIAIGQVQRGKTSPSKNSFKRIQAELAKRTHNSL